MQEFDLKLLNSGLLGDLAISLEMAERQAKEEGHLLERELAILMVHGILHLIGFDHERGGPEEERMGKKEKEILQEIESLLSVKGKTSYE